MDRRGKIYIILTALVVVLIVIIEYNKPQKINWFPSYAKHHKIPFGTYVFYNQLERIYNNNFAAVERPPFEYLGKNETIKGTYFFVNDVVQFDEAELDRLLNWTSNGNTLAIASASIPEALIDTLNLETSLISNFNNFDNIFDVKLKNNKLSHQKKHTFTKANFLNYFSKIDSMQTKVIATIANTSQDDSFSEEQYTNVIKQPFGDGEIILNLFPQAYTNYFILENDNKDYTAGLLSYLNTKKPLYLDNYYKSGKTVATSPLYVFLKAKELRWAYYIMILGALFYVIFDGKRKQRAIPIVKPLKNQTLDFTRTIANMYYESGKHADIAQHKIQHFLEFIRTQLHLNTNTIDDIFIKNVSARSNNTIEDTKALFKDIEIISNSTQITQEALEKLNASIETYKSNNTWKTKT